MGDIAAITTPQAVDWPKVMVGGRSITLRYSFAAGVQLSAWGKSVIDGTASVYEIGAAMAGNFDDAGKWRSIGYPRAIDFADEVQEAEAVPLMEAAREALKKAFPGVTFSDPGAAKLQTTDPATPKKEPSDSGPSPDPPPA